MICKVTKSGTKELGVSSSLLMNELLFMLLAGLSKEELAVLRGQAVSKGLVPTALLCSAIWEALASILDPWTEINATVHYGTSSLNAN